MRWNFQNYRDFILQTSTLLEQKFTNLYKLKPRGMNSRGPIENLICKMYDFIELWGLWHPIGILNGVFKITNLLKSRVPSVNISSKASSSGTPYAKPWFPSMILHGNQFAYLKYFFWCSWFSMTLQIRCVLVVASTFSGMVSWIIIKTGQLLKT